MSSQNTSDANPPKLVVVGSANIDLVTRVPRCPKAGESLIGRAFATAPGGKGANQAVAAARLGARTVFCGCAGRDAFGVMQREGLAAAGVDVSFLLEDPDLPTGTAVILVADDGQNAIVVTPSANYNLRPEHVEKLAPAVADANALLVQLEIPLDSVEAALELAAAHGVVSIVDAGPAQKVAPELLAKAAVVSPNETEAEAMTGIAVSSLEDAHRAAEVLLGMGAREVVIKLGARGAFHVGERHAPLHVPAFAVAAVDAVAAGDAFTAALALKWGACSREEALRFANAAGALATTRPGAQDAMPALAEVEQLLRDHGKGRE